MASGHMNRVKRPDTWLHRKCLAAFQFASHPHWTGHLPKGDQPDALIEVRRYGTGPLTCSIDGTSIWITGPCVLTS